MGVKLSNLFKIINSNSKGQAALMDSLFFLAIVSAVCTTLFFFTANYGNQLDSQINSFYSTDFAADTIKVVSYINVLRTGLSVYDSSRNDLVELDYLLAMMKEDYGDKKEFTCQTKKAIASTFSSVLKPFSDSLDYAFYFTNKSDDKFLFLMLAVHECDNTTDPLACVCYGNVNDPACASYVSVEPEISLTHYYCTPSDITILDQSIFPYVGKVDKATSKFDFLDSSGNSTVFDAELAMWVTKEVPSLTNISTNRDFNCSPIILTADCP